jgi:hypothetical protein
LLFTVHTYIIRSFGVSFFANILLHTDRYEFEFAIFVFVG